MDRHKLLVFSVGLGVALSFAPRHALAQSADQQTQDQQPSVAEAARKARAEKKTPAKTAKVLTNDDLSDIKGTINVVGEAPAPTGDAAKTPAATAAPAQTKGEAYFKQKFADARKTLADDLKELDVLQREFNLKQTQYYSDPNVAMREQNSREDINKTQAEIDAKKTDVSKDQAAISDLEDDLRKSDGDPGWETPPQ